MWTHNLKGHSPSQGGRHSGKRCKRLLWKHLIDSLNGVSWVITKLVALTMKQHTLCTHHTEFTVRIQEKSNDFNLLSSFHWVWAPKTSVWCHPHSMWYFLTPISLETPYRFTQWLVALTMKQHALCTHELLWGFGMSVGLSGFFLRVLRGNSV